MSSADEPLIDLRTPLLASLPKAALDRIRRAVQTRHFAAGETVLAEGEAGDELFIIAEGEVQVVARDAHGQPRTLAHLRQAECFGELSLLSGEPASASVIALGDTTLWALSHTDFAAIAEDHPELSQNLSTLLGERLRTANRQYLRTRRGRLVCLAGPGSSGDPWPFWLSHHLALSIARHTRRQVAFLDLSRHGSQPLHAGPPARSLGDVAKASRRRDRADHTLEQDARVQAVSLGSEEGPPSEAELTLALEHLQEEGQDVLAYVSRGDPMGDFISRRADTAVAFCHESDASLGASRQGELGTPNHGQLRLALLSEQKGMPTGADLRRAQSSWSSTVQARCIIPGGANALREHVAEASSTQRAIDRLARSLTGLTIGLALGGGGAKGYAHIGVLGVLQRAGVPLDCVAGCSIGAPLAAGVAAEWSLDEIRAQLDGISQKAVRLNVPIVSVLTSRSIQNELRNLIDRQRFEDLPTPAGIVAVDITTGREVLLRKGLVWPALMASMAYPGIYEPIRIGSRYLVDGGLLNPVPVSAALRLGANVVISSNLSASSSEDDTGPAGGGPPSRPFIVQTISRSLEIMQSRIVQESGSRADVEIVPEYAERPGLLDFKRGPEIEEAGAQAAERALPKLRKALPWLPGA